jgi:hypothetical protein
MSHIPQDVTPWEMAYQVEELVVTSASLQRSQSDSIEPAVVEAADMATLLPGIVTR